MKKICSILILLILISSCKTIQKTDFELLIEQYPHNIDYLKQYEDIYNHTNNIIYSVNKINYPNFLTPKSGTYDAFTFDNIIFVNTNYTLAKTYISNNLITVNNVSYIKRVNQNMQLEQDTFNSYCKLYSDAKKYNLNLTIFSGYRSYEYQGSIYNKEDNSFIAFPGTSEHQTGQAIDIATLETGLTSHFTNTIEYAWLIENAHKYGFILRYPQNKETITGYPFEPWHFRYVGNKVASIIYNENITLEEYIYSYVIL